MAGIMKSPSTGTLIKGSGLSKYRCLSFAGRKRIVENLWRVFFAEPSQWWDHRFEKDNAKHPDFKHKKTKESLWLDSNLNPPWVEAELADIAPGTIKLNIFSWNKRLESYVKAGEHEKAISLFHKMQREDVISDQFTFVRVLNACASLRALKEGRVIHRLIIQSGHELDVFVGTSLVDMYAKCGSIEDACRVFRKMPTRNSVTWTAMILGFVKCGKGRKALELFEQMHREGVEPNAVTFVAVLSACASEEALEKGRLVHEQIIQSGCESNVFVNSCLVDMYAKCGSIKDAWRVFSKVSTRDAASWGAMILGFVKCGQGKKALELFRQMQQMGVEPNPMTFVAVLNACASVAALEEGRCVHKQITRSNCESDVFVGNSLVDMYAKCGSIEESRRVFDKMPTRDVVSWTAMLGGYAMHGCAKEALEQFERMYQAGVEMDGVTFVSLLSACSHAGLVDEGLHYFESMSVVYNVFAAFDHYACKVDLLGRAGRIHEAEDLIKTMSYRPNVTVWRSLLSACTVHGSVEIGECVAKRVLTLDPENAAGYVLLSNLYSEAEMWDSNANI